MTQLEYTRLAQILGNQSAVNQWMVANEELVNGQPSKVALPEITLPRREQELPAIDENQPAVGQGALPVSPPQDTGTVMNQDIFGVSNPRNDRFATQTADMRNQRLMGPMQEAYSQAQWVADVYKRQADARKAAEQAEYDRLYNPAPGTPEYKQMQQDKWWNIAAQFLKPTASSSLGESFGNVASYLGSEAAAQRANRAALNKRLMELGQAYDVKGLESQFDLLGNLMKPKDRWAGSAYDQPRGIRVVPPGSDPSTLIPTQDAIKLPNGQTYVKWNDGLYRISGASADTPDAYVVEGDPTDPKNPGQLRKWSGGVR